MENKSVFNYSYSAQQASEIERIRQKYLPREESKLERIKELDRRIQSAGMLESLCMGIIGVLLFGVGMCFGLGALAGADYLAYLFGVLGLIVMLPAYPVYKHVAKKVKARLAPEILQISEEIAEK